MSHADDERPTTADEAAFDAELRLALEASPAAPSAATRAAILAHARGLAAGPVSAPGAAEAMDRPDSGDGARGRPSRSWRVPLGSALAAAIVVALVWPLAPGRGPVSATGTATVAPAPAGGRSRATVERASPAAPEAVPPAPAVTAPSPPASGTARVPPARSTVPPPAAAARDAVVTAVVSGAPATTEYEPAKPPGAVAAGSVAGAGVRREASERASDRAALTSAPVAPGPMLDLHCGLTAAAAAATGLAGPFRLRIQTGLRRYSVDDGRTWLPIAEVSGSRYLLRRWVRPAGDAAVETLDGQTLRWEQSVEHASGPVVVAAVQCAEAARQ